MNERVTNITLYESARQALSTAVKIDEVKNILDRSAGLAEYARRAKDPELIANATELRKYATRRLGEILAEDREAGRLAKGEQSAKGFTKNPLATTLASQGIDKNLADRARKAAATDEETFAAEVAKEIQIVVAAAQDNKAVITAARAERHQEKTEKRAAAEAKLADKLLSLPHKRYAVIVADPEWKFEFWSSKGNSSSSAENYYPTSELDAIKQRRVAEIAADDCVLFLWATMPMLPQALEVMATWGFSYKSNLAWIKHKPGTGYWFRNQHELLLVGTRGHIPAPAEGDQVSSILFAPAGKHSAKPEDALEIIERYYPTVPKIELNRRGAPRNGWDAWGLEVESQNETVD